QQIIKKEVMQCVKKEIGLQLFYQPILTLTTSIVTLLVTYKSVNNTFQTQQMSNNNIPNNPNDTNSSRASSLNERKPYSRRTPQSITFSDDDTDSDEMSYTSEDDYYETHDMYDDDDSDIEIAPVFQTTTEIDRNEP